MKIYALLLTLMASVGAAISESHPQCCMKDKQYQTGFGGSIGQFRSGAPEGIEFGYELAIDVPGRQSGGEGFAKELGGLSIPVKFIQVWSEKIQYTIVNENCIVTALTTPEPSSCTPSNATYVATIKQGKDEFTTQAWSLNPSDLGLKDGVAYISVSDTTCVPIGVTFMGTLPGPVPSHVSAGYFNFSSGIPDPKRWFDIPSSCQHKKLGAPKPGPLEGIISLLHSMIF